MSKQDQKKETQFQNALDASRINYASTLATETASLLQDAKLTLVTAESLTGGAIASHIVHQPGASAYFLGALVCYNTRLKLSLCGVQAKTIRQHSVISQEVATEMAAGAKKRCNADIALATTGLAGPPTDEWSQKNHGKVAIAMTCPNRNFSKSFRFTGSREHIIQQTVDTSLGLLRNYLKSHTGEVEN